MNYPKELHDFWADWETWGKAHNPEDWPVSTDAAAMFERHLKCLQSVADSGDDNARYAISSIYLLNLIYSDVSTRAERYDRDRSTMTELLYQCARNGMVVAFDNLVTSGVGEMAKSARAAARDYETIQNPDWDELSGMPVYTPMWMESAMRLWRSRQGESGPLA